MSSASEDRFRDGERDRIGSSAARHTDGVARLHTERDQRFRQSFNESHAQV